jgi:hypothetical protein
MVAKNDYDQVLKTISTWPVEDRAALATDLIRGLGDQPRDPVPRDTLSKALGLLRGNGPPPSDEDVERMIDEHRMSKYGQR